MTPEQDRVIKAADRLIECLAFEDNLSTCQEYIHDLNTALCECPGTTAYVFAQEMKRRIKASLEKGEA